MRYAHRRLSKRRQTRDAVWECLDTAELVREVRNRYTSGTGDLEIDAETLTILGNVRRNLAMELVRFHDGDWRGCATADELHDITAIEAEATAILRCCGHREELAVSTVRE